MEHERSVSELDLKELDLSQNKITPAAAAALHAALLPTTLRVLNLDLNPLKCPVANARTRAAVEQQSRFFRGECELMLNLRAITLSLASPTRARRARPAAAARR